MSSVIFNPSEEYDSKYQQLHRQNAGAHLDELIKRSLVNIEENRKTVKQYDAYRESLKKLKRKLNWLRFFRVLMIITLLLIPLVIFWLTPKIKALRAEIAQADQRARALLEEAQRQMAPLNGLFTDRDALHVIEKTIPQLSFAPCFTAEQEEDMRVNYDFCEVGDWQQSTTDLLAGHYNENPFVFESKLVHTMGTELYHGYKTIHWTETYRDSNGKLQTRHRTQTLHATVAKPKPFYSTKTTLHYCAQGGPELSFTRADTHLEEKSEKQIERYIKKGERKLQRKTDKAIRKNDSFTSMANTDFEVLFGALDRNNEVQFRSLFTPLAQTNMVDLILSKSGYEDDFHFIKRNRANKIVTAHSQGRALVLPADGYRSHSFDIIKQSFLELNAAFFKAVYFDFAPLWSIPAYQERPVHSLKPIPDGAQAYSNWECEAIANTLPLGAVAHPRSQTRAILKSDFIRSQNGKDEIKITAYSYDVAKRLDFVMMLGGDRRMHGVPVPWDEYLPLEAQNTFLVGKSDGGQAAMTRRNDLCIFKL